MANSINNANDIGFIQDIAGLDSLRKKAVKGDKASEKEALQAAARQFESIFTSMMLKSMRDANSAFKSGMFDSQAGDMYQKMKDEQMASSLSAHGSLGLADMIVKQLSQANLVNDQGERTFHDAMERVHQVRAEKASEQLATPIHVSSEPATKVPVSSTATKFDSPQSFVKTMKPYADKAAKMLGVDSTLLLAQAALETGWGQKMVKNARETSNNLFNIKASSGWKGDKIATQTLEYQDNTPVMEKAAFRAYPSYQASFDDYVHFLKNNPRYSNALAQKGDENFIRNIHQAGYATDPNYADKVLKLKSQIESMNKI
ncbi:flagellar assembly peptidoglycan hydrolase FlgJ [Vibrio nitrifigilis]|uniref:Peptidoglycan hydrolase FlgJ n=1 Tax=Vibrio nitrifigilis TaxID=2789781 RepID=A0ABS0GAP3_9VIBR|nr:flagellar assembly peptidoglycan hydrolase FlgJ [Vibrio nitrifigilis]MBF8999440.1 flagellar assembly peptidoglycan hydrolase FlgJ [Vibrio nitrifigilis]